MKRLFGHITPNNTTAWDNGSDAGCFLHQTCVVYVDWDAGTVKLRSGGYETVTTKRRINEASKAFGLGFKVYAKNHKWYVDTREGETVEFVSGMTLPLPA